MAPLRSVGGLVALCLTTLAGALRAQSSDHQALRRIKEVDWPRAYREQDPALLDRLLADDFRRVGSDGRSSTKQEELAYVRTHKPAYDSLVFRIERLDVYPGGSAIVGGTGFVYAKDAGTPSVTEYKSTNVFIKQNGVWRAVASHTSGDRARPRS